MPFDLRLIIVPETIGAMLALISVSLACYYWYCVNRHHYWVGKGIPSTSPPSFFSNLARKISKKHPHDVERDLYRKFGKVFGSYMGTRPMIYLADTELIKQILIKDFSRFSNRRVIVTGKPIHDLMLVVIRGNEQWKNIRNTMTPAFSSGKLKKMLPLICECARITANNFRKYSSNGTSVDCKRLFGCYSLDVIANVAFGTKLDSHNDIDNLFVRRAKDAFSPGLSWRRVVSLLFPKLGSLLVNKFFHQGSHFDFFRDVVLSIMERRENTKEERNDFLQLMIESMKEEPNQKESESNESINQDTHEILTNGKKRPLTKEEVLAQTILFFVAGFDTTSIALTVTTYFLGLNPECQRKAAEEANLIFLNKDTVDADDLNEAKYLGACIDEALRLSPPLARLDRTCVNDYKLGETGVTIPAGMVVQIPIFSLHRDPIFFNDPEKFIPERFLEENKRKINPYAYMPFGAGPRSCVAMRLALLEVKLCLLYLLREFEFSPSKKIKVPMQYHKNFLLQPKDVILNFSKK